MGLGQQGPSHLGQSLFKRRAAQQGRLFQAGTAQGANHGAGQHKHLRCAGQLQCGVGDPLKENGQAFCHLAHRVGRLIGFFQRPAQTDEGLAQPFALGKTVQQDVDGFAQEFTTIHLLHIGSALKCTEITLQLLQYQILAPSGHGAHQHFLAGKVLVQRPNRKPCRCSHFVGCQAGFALSVQNLSSRFEKGLNGLLSTCLGGLSPLTGLGFWACFGFGRCHLKAF